MIRVVFTAARLKRSCDEALSPGGDEALTSGGNEALTPGGDEALVLNHISCRWYRVSQLVFRKIAQFGHQSLKRVGVASVPD